MARFAAISTSDASLVRCELDRLRPHVEFDGEGLVVGVGAYAQTVVLQRFYGLGVAHAEVWEVPDSETAILAAAPLPPGRSIEADAPPFRFRQWVFALAGAVDAADRVRERLFGTLPDFLRRVIRGVTIDEVVFACFLSELRDLGRLEDPQLEASVAAQVLARVARRVEAVSAEVGGTQKPSLAAVATNGRIVVAARRGAQPLSYALYEGEPTCARCGLTGETSDPVLLVREHRRRRSVVVATNPLRGTSWVHLADGCALAIDRRLEVQVL